jgi:hypothetical protein
MIEDQSSLRKKQFEEKQKAKDADDRSMMADVDGSSAPQIAVQGVQKSPPANKESKDIKLRQAPPSESRKVSVNYQMRSAKEKGGLRLAPGRASQPSVMSEASDTKQQTVTLDLDPSFSTDSVDTVASLETDVRINMPPSAPGAYAVAGPGLLDGDEEDLESGEIRPTDEGAPPIEGTLALSLEQARAKMLAEAVVAGEVHRTTSKQRRTLITFTIVLVVLISAILGAVLGALLGQQDESDTEVTPTDPPTPLPTSPQFNAVAALVESEFGTSLEDTSTPQYRAAEWLANVDTMFDFVSGSIDTAHFRQRFALVLLYYATEGYTSWKYQANFLSPGVHECDWNIPFPDDLIDWYHSVPLGVSFCADKFPVALETEGRVPVFILLRE